MLTKAERHLKENFTMKKRIIRKDQGIQSHRLHKNHWHNDSKISVLSREEIKTLNSAVIKMLSIINFYQLS